MQIIKKLGLGTVQFGLPYGISNTQGKTAPEEVTNIINMARQEGIQYLDSASAYGNAEEVLGLNDLKDFAIVSKFLLPVEKSISEQLNQSLENLKISSLYGYLAHRPMDILENPDHWKELQNFQNKGLVKKIGFSLNEPDELNNLLDAGFVPEIIQVPYNYLDRRFENLMKQLKGKSCEIHTRSCFLQGLFFMKVDDLDNFFADIKPLLKELQGLNNLNGALMKFVLDKPFIDQVIIGIENSAQLKNNIESLEMATNLPEVDIEIPLQILIPSQWPKK